MTSADQGRPQTSSDVPINTLQDQQRASSDRSARNATGISTSWPEARWPATLKDDLADRLHFAWRQQRHQPAMQGGAPGLASGLQDPIAPKFSSTSPLVNPWRLLNKLSLQSALACQEARRSRDWGRPWCYSGLRECQFWTGFLLRRRAAHA